VHPFVVKNTFFPLRNHPTFQEMGNVTHERGKQKGEEMGGCSLWLARLGQFFGLWC
jgi:hypothetical protein